MNNRAKQITIHLSRIGKPERAYQEGLVKDDGIRLKTFSLVPRSVGLHLSEEFCQQGLLLPGQCIHSVSKYHFYNEFFSIIVYQDREGRVLGYYCDLITPLQRKGDEYFLIDLILDLWIFPDYRTIELDREEFEEAIAHGMFPSSFESETLATLRRLKSEIEQGIFPRHYLF
jgi:predicted RNA-binding protein associated with RNAse of E/G family